MHVILTSGQHQSLFTLAPRRLGEHAKYMLLQQEMDAGVTCKCSTSLNVRVAHVHLVVGEGLNVWFVIGSRTHQGIKLTLLQNKIFKQALFTEVSNSI